METIVYNSKTGRTKPLYRGVQAVWYVLGILEVLLAFRFVLKLLGANPGAGFTDFIYSLSYIFAAPFLAVFRMTKVEGSIFEWTTLLAMLVYWIAAYGVIRLFAMSRPVSSVEAQTKLIDEDK